MKSREYWKEVAFFIFGVFCVIFLFSFLSYCTFGLSSQASTKEEKRCFYFYAHDVYGNITRCKHRYSDYLEGCDGGIKIYYARNITEKNDCN